MEIRNLFFSRGPEFRSRMPLDHHVLPKPAKTCWFLRELIYERVNKQNFRFFPPNFGKTQQQVCLQNWWSQLLLSVINVPQAHISNSASHIALRVILTPLSHVTQNDATLLLQQIVACRNAILMYKLLPLTFRIWQNSNVLWLTQRPAEVNCRLTWFVAALIKEIRTSGFYPMTS